MVLLVKGPQKNWPWTFSQSVVSLTWLKSYKNLEIPVVTIASQNPAKKTVRGGKMTQTVIMIFRFFLWRRSQWFLLILHSVFGLPWALLWFLCVVSPTSETDAQLKCVLQSSFTSWVGLKKYSLHLLGTLTIQWFKKCYTFTTKWSWLRFPVSLTNFLTFAGHERNFTISN